MKNDAISSLKNHFPHPGKMVCHVSKLAQFGPNLKLWRISGLFLLLFLLLLGQVQHGGHIGLFFVVRHGD